MKKLLALVLSIVLTLSLAACGGNGISQEDYDRIITERDALFAEIEALRSEVDALRSEVEGLRNAAPPQDTPEVRIGGLIDFGGISWRVLDIQDGRVLIISENILFARAYHSNSITWEDSSLRHFLNGEFYLNTFTAEERRRIVETAARNDPNPNWGTPGGNDTTDKVFLLSIEEAQRYFIDDEARVAFNAIGSAYWWWLRSPGFDAMNAAGVDDDGRVRADGSIVANDSAGVRPALWLNPES